MDQDGQQLSLLLIALFKGVLYRDQNPELWQDLLTLQPRVHDYVEVLGLDLLFDDTEGFAYLRQRPAADGEAELPRLVARRQLSYPVSLLLALLRKKLAEHDATGGEARLILSRDQLVDLLRIFLPATANEARLMDRIDNHINKVVDLGFMRRLRGQDDQFQVQRLLKGFVDAQWLAGLDKKLGEYREQVTDNSSPE